MRLLLKLVSKNKKHLVLFAFVAFGVIGLSVASQLEVFSVGVVVKTGSDFFLVFGKEKKNGKLTKVSEVDFEEVNARLKEIQSDTTQPLTKEIVNEYLAKRTKKSFIQKGMDWLDKNFHIHKNLCALAIFLFFVAIFKAVFLFTNRFCSQLVAIRVGKDLRLSYFKCFQSLPFSFYDHHDVGNLTSRINTDSQQIATSINSLFINYLYAPFIFVSSIISCLCISFKLCLLVFLGFPLLVLPVLFIAKRIKLIAKLFLKKQEKFSSILVEFLTGIMTAKLFQTENYVLSKYRDENNAMASLEEKSALYALSARPILHAVSSLFFALIMVAGLYKFCIPPEELLIFCGTLYIAYEPCKKFADENNNIMKGIAAAERFNELMDIIKVSEEKAKESLLHFSFEDKITFQNVSFSYNGIPILNNISFSIKKGETIGIVGPTGSGKSTLMKLLPKLYDSFTGDILIDNTSISKISFSSLRKFISYVPQNSFLFSDSVWNNLTFGENFSEEEIDCVVKQARLDDFVFNLPGKYNFLIEEAGKNLSGGQQQRFAIARALLKNFSILILDEATSALDSINESYIKIVLEEFKRKKTQIIIAHKLTTLDFVDRIIYLEQGNLIAEGTKEQLLKNCPEFKKMWQYGNQELSYV